MKFLKKDNKSRVLGKGLTYSKSHGNSRLRKLLLDEQRGFCAYSEQYIRDIKPCKIGIDHFDPDKNKKRNDDYWNWYVVLGSINNDKGGPLKKEQNFKGAAFFKTCFFHDPKQVQRRIGYNRDFHIFFPTDTQDEEECKDTQQFLDFILVNSENVLNARLGHINRLRDFFSEAQYSSKRQMENYLNRNISFCSFVTAIEATFNIKIILSGK